MSLDYYLNKKDASKLEEGDLSKLPSDLKVSINATDPDGYVSSFIANSEDYPQEIEFAYQQDNKYWTYTYNYGDEDFPKFIQIVSRIAEYLDMKIEDPQAGKTDLTPDEFSKNPNPDYLKIHRNTVDRLGQILSSNKPIDGLVKEYRIGTEDGKELSLTKDFLVSKLDNNFELDNLDEDQEGNVIAFSVKPKKGSEVEGKMSGEKLLKVDFVLDDSSNDLVGTNQEERGIWEQMDFSVIVEEVGKLLGLVDRDSVEFV